MKKIDKLKSVKFWLTIFLEGVAFTDFFFTKNVESIYVFASMVGMLVFYSVVNVVQKLKFKEFEVTMIEEGGDYDS